MRLDLHEIIDQPGSSKSFEFSPDFGELEFNSLAGIQGPVEMSGTVRNTAGLLTLTGTLKAELICICARCAREFPQSLVLPIELTLAEEVQDEGNSDIWLLEGDFVDLDEIALTAFVLSIDTRFLCSEDCKGLCSKCGKNLNEGPCGCRSEVDPRLAVLGQLLKDNQEE